MSAFSLNFELCCIVKEDKKMSRFIHIVIWYFSVPSALGVHSTERCAMSKVSKPQFCDTPSKCAPYFIPDLRVGESLFEFLKFSIDFPYCKRLNQPFKRSIWQKRSQGCNVLSPLIYLKVWKKLYLLAFLSTPGLGELGSRFSITNITVNSKLKSERLKT